VGDWHHSGAPKSIIPLAFLLFTLSFMLPASPSSVPLGEHNHHRCPESITGGTPSEAIEVIKRIRKCQLAQMTKLPMNGLGTKLNVGPMDPQHIEMHRGNNVKLKQVSQWSTSAEPSTTSLFPARQNGAHVDHVHKIRTDFKTRPARSEWSTGRSSKCTQRMC
jgi:hypothetical protein